MRRFSADDGAVAVFTALLAVLLFAMAALVVDLGLARDNRRQAQNTADAAALAAANALYAEIPFDRLNEPGDYEAAIDAAKEYAERNYGTTPSEWDGCSTDEPLDVVHAYSGTNCISFDDDPYPRNVLVVVPLREQPTLFGGVVGYTGVSIGALAQARLAPGGVPTCVFCVIKETDHDIQNGELVVDGGNIWINGNLSVGPGGTVKSIFSDVTDTGGKIFVSLEIDNKGIIDPEPRVRQPRIVDPLAATTLPFPTQGTLPPAPKTDPCSQGPGFYDTADVSGCTLAEGLYVFTGGIRISGTENFATNGATLYFTCGSGGVPEPCDSPGELGAGIEVTGQGDLTFVAPTEANNPNVSEELYGFAVVFDRYNTAEISFRGNGAFQFDGTVYAVNSKMWNAGNGCTNASTAMVVIGSVEFSGTDACFATTYDSEKNALPSDGDRGLVR